VIIPALVAPLAGDERVATVDPAVGDLILTPESGARMIHTRIRHRSGPAAWTNTTGDTWDGAGVFSAESGELLIRLVSQPVYPRETVSITGMEPVDG